MDVAWMHLLNFDFVRIGFTTNVAPQKSPVPGPHLSERLLLWLFICPGLALTWPDPTGMLLRRAWTVVLVVVSYLVCLNGQVPLYTSGGFYTQGSIEGNRSIPIFSTDFDWNAILPRPAGQMSSMQQVPDTVTLAVPSVMGDITLEGKITFIGPWASEQPELLWVTGYIPPLPVKSSRSQERLFNMIVDPAQKTIKGECSTVVNGTCTS